MLLSLRAIIQFGGILPTPLGREAEKNKNIRREQRGVMRGKNAERQACSPGSGVCAGEAW